METRILEFRAALPLHRYPLHKAGLLGADLAERNSEKPCFLEACYEYRRQLVDIELYRRQARRAVLLKLYPRLVALSDQIEAMTVELTRLRGQLSSARARVRARITLPAVEKQIKLQRAALAKLRTEYNKAHERATALSSLEGAQASLKSNRNKNKPAKQETLHESIAKYQEIADSYTPSELDSSRKLADEYYAIAKDVDARKSALYGSSDLHWGTKNAISEGVEASRSGPPPQQRRGEGEVMFSVQLQAARRGGETRSANWQALLTDNAWSSQVRLRAIPAAEVAGFSKSRPGQAIRNGVKSQHQHMLQIRVTADSEKGWVEMPFHFRPDRWPADAKILYVRIRRRKLRARYQWLVQFVVTSEQFSRQVGTGEVGINLGSRLLKNGLRAAYAVDDTGHSETLELPHEDFVRHWRYTEELQAIRDREFTAMLTSLRDWLKRHKKLLPGWLREEAKTLHLQKAKRVARLVMRWRDNRFDGDEKIFADVNYWRSRKNGHLLEWQNSEMGRTNGRRKSLYQKWAADLRKRYGTVYIGKINYRELREVEEPEDEAGSSEVRKLAARAAIGSLKVILQMSGMKVVERDPSYTTQLCHVCGHVNDFDAASRLEVVCESCASCYDQDYNAAHNLLTGRRPKSAGKELQAVV